MRHKDAGVKPGVANRGSESVLASAEDVSKAKQNQQIKETPHHTPDGEDGFSDGLI